MSTSSGYDTASTFSRLNEHYISDTSSGSSVSEYDNFFSSARRAGGPYLCSLPVRTVPFPAGGGFGTLQRERSRIYDHTIAILEQEDIEHNSVALVGRLSVVEPEPDCVPTLLITTPPRVEFEKEWVGVARQIFAALSTVVSGVSVEIIDEEEAKPAQCWPVADTDSIFTKWPKISQALMDGARTWRWRALSCWRYGKAARRVDNPVTGIIMV